MANIKTRKHTRRGNNEGSIFQRSNGQWVGSITIGYNEDGVQQKKTVYGKSRMEVESKLAIYSDRLKSNSFEKLENSTASELMKEWLVIFKKNTILPRTFQSDMNIFKLHIEPKIRYLHLQDLDDITIQKVLNNLIEKDYSLSTVKKTKFIFNQFLDYCEQSKWIPYNPARKVKVRIKDKKIYSGQSRYKALTPEQRIHFLEMLNETPRKILKPLCHTLMFGGLRIGEALGLQWKDIDFEDKSIRVNKAASLEPKFDSNGNVIYRKTKISDTKTACSNRVVPIPDILVQTLYEWKQKQEENGILFHQDYTNSNSYVFCDDNNQLRTYSSCRLMFDRFKKYHKIQDWHIGFHGLRHTFSNMLFEMNENPKVIQAILGHKDVRTTITIYNSVDQDYIRKSTEKLNAKFKVENPILLEEVNKQKSDNQETDYQDLDDEEFEEMLRRLEKEKSRRKHKEKDFEM